MFQVFKPQNSSLLYSRVSEVSTRFDYPASLKKFRPFSIFSPSSFSSFHFFMLNQPKTSRREHSSETISSIIVLHASGQSHSEIAHQIGIPKTSVTRILHRIARDPKNPQLKNKKHGRPRKLDERAKRNLIRHVEKYSQENLHSLSTSSKSGQQLFRNIVRKYLKTVGYLRFKTRRKSFLTDAQRKIRLKWAMEHRHWTLNCHES